MGKNHYKSETNSINLISPVMDPYAPLSRRATKWSIHKVSFLFFICIWGSLILISLPAVAAPPSADPLPDLGPFACYSNIPSPDINDVTGETSDCGGPVTVTFLSDSPNPGCSGTVVRSYQLEDTCGIIVVIQQNIFIDDNIAPTANPLSPLGPYGCYSNIPPPNINLVTGETDNCGGAVTVSHFSDSPNPGCSGTVTRTYLLTDACANTSLITQNITINDVTPPVITCPPNITASCPEDVPAPNPASVSWTDNCGMATVTHVSDDTLIGYQKNGAYCTSIFTRTYQATDPCGNAVQCEQTIVIQDICDPGYECPNCEDIVPHFTADFTDNPDGSWTSPEVVRNGLCCAQLGPPPPRCIHFTIILPQSVVAISFNISSGAQPSGSLFYQIDCNEVHQVGDTICLTGGNTYELTFCKPGNNENTYTIESFTANFVPDTVITQVDCAVEITAEGIVESTAVWNDITGGGMYNSYLSCLMGCLTTTFTPDSNAPAFIQYEVCGDAGTMICGQPVDACDTILAFIHPEIMASVNPNPATYCANNIGTLTGSVTPPGTYSMQWHNGPNGTGPVVGTGANFTPTTSGTYSFVVTELLNNFNCPNDTVNVPVTIVPLPQFNLGPDTSVCTSATVFFDLPNGPTYTWSPTTGVTSGGDNSQFIVTGSSTTSYTVTATTPQGCTWMDTWAINVVNCTIDCPEQFHCSAGDILVYQTVSGFLSAGGVISLPCTIQDGSITLVSVNSDGGSCPETITHTYEIEDDCGNVQTCDVVIILDDLIAPGWTSSPAPIGPLNCSDPLPAHENLSATDNCSIIINTSIDSYVADMCNGYSVTLRWTLMDSCGNSAPDQTLVVSFLPQPPPTFISPPGNTTITCEDVSALVIPDLAFDNGQTGACEISGTVPGVLNGPINECGGQFTIEWNYTDTCDRTIFYIQTITVTDDVDPVITCPGNLNFECNADVPLALTTYADFTVAGGTATDNCGLLISSFMVSETDNGTCPRTITRTYSIEDSCANIAQCVQTIIVDDQENPIITCPGNQTFECSGDVPPALATYTAFINGGGNASDNCGLDETTFSVTETDNGTCPRTITRTYSIVDSCGNTGQCIQIITVDDQENPVITCPGNGMFECSGDVPPALNTYADFIAGGGSAFDNCGLLENTFSVTETNNGTCPRTITRTYTIADSCGNTGQCVQTIIVDDQENPIITCPGNGMFECSGDVPPALTTYAEFIAGGGSASDNCELVETSFTFTETDNGTCPRTITRTYSIADSCGNTGQCVQTIIVDDQVNPVITCPANEMIECSADVPPTLTTYAQFIAGGGSASDNCELVESTFTFTESDNGTCPRTITRTYSIADSCGNMGQCVQSITVDDQVNPIITCPPAEMFECSADVPPAAATYADFISLGGSASDNCGLVETTFSVTETNNGTCPRNITRTYTIADSCGNIGQCVQTITVDDQVNPVITCPGNEMFECSADVPPAPITYADFFSIGGSASDNCGLVETTFSVTESDNGTCPRTITRMYSIADSCGNIGQCTQTITVDDQVNPVITCPAIEIFECSGDISPAFTSYTEFINGGGSVSDNCGVVESTFLISETDNGTCPRTITRTYSIADSCNNIGQCVQTITIDDQVNPVITCPANNTYECSGDVPPVLSSYTAFINGGGSASDNCGLVESTFSVMETNIGTCPRIITRTYTIADSCGNIGQCVQTITVDDQVNPVITCPGNNMYECSGDVPPALNTYAEFIAGGGSASDNCELVETSFTLIETDNGTCPRTITRTYTIADSCGNIGQCVQIITVDDQVNPVITCPGNGMFECSGDVPPALTTYAEFISGGGSASDNCELVESSFSVTETDNGTCPRNITRTYSIADSCGNIGQCVQTITVDDQVNPIITCPGNEMLECSADVPPAPTTYAGFISLGGSASDNCGLVETTFSVTETDNGTCPRTITRMYSIADSCGNIGQCTQTITVDDQENPVITCPGNEMFECSADVPPAPVTYADFINNGGSASDNCGLVETTFSVTETDNGTCPRTITRMYSIADSCGNIGQCTQTITVDDQENPNITCPGNEMFECSGDISPAFTSYTDFINGGGNISDNCGVVEPTFSLTESDNGTCPRTITRIYSIADSCGNIGQCTQTITIDDQAAPVITCPGDLDFECAGDVPPAFTSYTEFINGGGSASDNCALDEAMFSITETDNGTCPRTITRTYSIADSCGNTGQCVQTITVDDQVDPVITCPGNQMFECSGDVPPALTTYAEFITGGGSASDNCDLVETSFTFTESENGACPRTITRTYSIADSCGNIGECVQTITVDDQVNPIITCPGDQMFECSADVPPAPSTYADFINLGGSASDNCGLVETSFAATETDNGNCPRTITRTYSIADTCGNIGQCVQTITVDDQVNPVITCPGNEMLDCSGDIPPALTSYTDFINGGGNASDNCGLVESSFAVTETDNGTCPRTVTRTYSIADSCGNLGECIQTITVDDQENPVITCPGDEMFECTGNVLPAYTSYTDFINGGGSASDNCGLVEPTFSVTETDNGTCPRTVTRTYSIADSCGNIGQCVQTITVDDPVDPVITCPGDLVFECNDDTPPLLTTYTEFINGGGSVSDNCALDLNSFIATESDNGTCPRTITRTYSIADSCGNTGQCTQTITIDDPENPVMTCPGDLDFECAGDVPPAFTSYTDFINGGGSVSDNCTIHEASFSITETDNGTCPRTITRTYSIADSCNNTGQCVQTIMVDDQVDPVIICPGDLMFECSGDVPPAFTTYAEFIAGGGSASDNCDLVESSFAVTETDAGICPRTITRTYSIEDSCGRIGQCVQTIIVDDNISPTASNPASITIECSGAVPPPDPLVVIDAADNCSAPVVEFVSDESDGGICPEIITRTYSVTDECDNQILVIQTITIGDDTPPTASDPAPISIECSGEAPDPDPSVVNDAADNCSVPVVEFVGDVSDGGTCPEIITRTYSVTDECDNQILVTQIITIGDDIPPTASDPAPITIECSGVAPDPDPTVVNDAADNCSVPVVAFVGDVSDGDICPEIITRTYSVTDECNNQLLVTQIITIGDNIPPTASNPDPISVAGCNMPVPPPDITQVTDASDNCDIPIVAFAGDAVSLQGCIETTTRTYSITDACDNSITVTQLITRTVDVIPPVFLNVPNNITVNCAAEIPSIPELEYTDNCSPGGTVIGTVDGPNGDPPIVVWTWNATDDCGNTATVTVTITVDETPIINNITDNFCNGDEYILPDSSITTIGGTFGPYTFTSSSGCDSIVTLELMGIDPVTITISDGFCEGEEYTLPDGTTTTMGGSYGPYLFVTEDGCDSTVFVELTLTNTVFTELDDEFCEGTTYVLPDGSTTTSGGAFGPYTFTSQFGCDSIVNLTLTEIDLPNVDITDEGPVCVSSGILTLTATPPGGTWSGAVNSDLFDPFVLGVGTHQIIYTITSGECERADTINIIVYELNLTCEALTEESFPGANDGTGSVSVSGGIPPYIVTWTGPVSGSVTLDMDGSFIITSLTAGVYTIEVTDSTGCTAVCEFTIIGNPPCELVIDTIVLQDATCPGVNDGSITVIVTGSAPPFEYSLDGINYQGSNLFDMLAPGTYTVFVLDAMGCIASQDVVIHGGDGPELSIVEIVNASCGVNNGSVLVSASGGTVPYMYSIDGVNYGLSPLFPGLFAGNYQVYLIDGNGCMDTIPANVEDSDAPVIIDIVVEDASCGLADGSITINATGGLGVLLYSINGGNSFQTSPVFNGLPAGTYTIVVQDEANCQVTSTASIQETGGPVITEIVIVPTSCEQSDGIITITATGVPTLQYSINGFNFQSSNIFQGLPAGNYTVTVRDGNGCITVGQVTLNTTNGPQIQNIQHTDTKCGLDNGTILITASGGTGELEYFLNGDSYGDQNFIEDLPAGVYFIEVVDESGCSATGQVTINPSEGPDFDVYITPAHCGLADGIIELDATAGTPPYTYSINGGSFTANFTFVNLVSDYYIMAIKDAKGCIFEQEVFLWEAPSPRILDVMVTHPDCGDVNGRIEFIATGNHLQYSIHLPNYQSSPFFYPVPPGTYTVTVRDTFSCTDSEVVVILPKPAPVIDVIVTPTDCGLSNGKIEIIASGGVTPLQYSINSGPFGSTNIFTMLPAGTYMVIVKGANGCEDSTSVVIHSVGEAIYNTSASICEGGQYILEGQVFTTPGIHSVTIPGGANNGCDSTIILNLTVDPLVHKLLLASICMGDFYSIDGHSFNIGGHYLLDTIPGINGCDTIRELELTTTPLEIKYLDINICIGDSFTIGVQTFNLPGEYLIDTVIALSGCDSILILRLNVDPLPNAVAGLDKILECTTPTVVLEGLAQGGDPLWTGPGINGGNQNDLTPLVSLPGTYILTVTSPSECEDKDTVEVAVDPELVLADAGVNAYFSCDIDTVILHAGPPGPDLIYQWSGPGINALNANLANPVITVPGIYTLVVTNTTTGCVSAPDTVIITDITTEIVAIVQNPNSLDCFSTFIDLDASASSIGSNLVYIWFNSSGDIIGNTPILEVTSGGMFTFVVLDTISGCFDEDTVSVTDLIAYPPVNAGDPQQIDCYNQTAILNAGAQNNLPNIVFLWTGPPGSIIGPDTLLSIVVGAPGIYYLEAEDTITGCKNIDSVMVQDLSDQPVADIYVAETITCIDNMALLNTGGSTSGTGIIYTWSGPGFNEVSAEVIEPTSAGLFTLTVFNNLTGCEAVDSVMLVLPQDILDLEAIVEVPVCAGDSSGSITITGITGGIPEYMYGIVGQPGQNSPLFENLPAGVYSVSITDGNGCTYSESVTIPEGNILTIDLGIDIELVLGDSITLGADINFPWSQVDSLVWTPADILSCNYCLNPVLYGLQDNVITAIVYMGSCLAEDMIEVRVDIDAEFYIPNVFSPNGDGINDHVTVFADPRVKRVLRLEIFDRWGNLVFIGSDFPPNDPLLGWDGTFKNQLMNPAVFAFWAEVELINDVTKRKKGDITLLR